APRASRAGAGLPALYAGWVGRRGSKVKGCRRPSPWRSRQRPLRLEVRPPYPARREQTLSGGAAASVVVVLVGAHLGSGHLGVRVVRLGQLVVDRGDYPERGVPASAVVLIDPLSDSPARGGLGVELLE